MLLCVQSALGLDAYRNGTLGSFSMPIPSLPRPSNRVLSCCFPDYWSGVKVQIDVNS